MIDNMAINSIQSLSLLTAKNKASGANRVNETKLIGLVQTELCKNWIEWGCADMATSAILHHGDHELVNKSHPQHQYSQDLQYLHR